MAAKRETIRKNPRALVDKLHAIEIKIMERIANNNFKCEFCQQFLLNNNISQSGSISGKELQVILEGSLCCCAAGQS